MLIEKIQGLTNENKEFLFNDKYSIFDIKPNGELLLVYFLKVEDIPDEDLDEDELEEIRLLYGYSFSIGKDEQKDYPDINYYASKFETAKRRNIVGHQRDLSYKKLTAKEVRQAKTIIATLDNGFKDMAFLIYVEEIKKYTLMARDKGNNSKPKIEPLHTPLFKESIEPSTRNLAIEKTMFMGSPTLHRKYTSKVVSALDIRRNPFGTRYTEFVINKAINLAKKKTKSKEKTADRLSSFFTDNERLYVSKKEKEIYKKASQIINQDNENE